MSRAEAERVLARTIEKLASETFDELWSMRAAEEHVYESVGSDGETYTTDIDVIRDRKSGDVEVIVSVDDGGDMAFKPPTSGFTILAGTKGLPASEPRRPRRWWRPNGS